MNPTEFERYRAQGYTRIPLSCELIADLDNPLSVFMKLADQPYTFLFESVQGGEKWGRYSIIGLPASQVIRIRANTVTISVNDVETESFEVDDPLQWIEEYQKNFVVPDVPGLPRITGGLVGYFGYDTVRYIEPRLGPNPHPDPVGNPDILLMVTSELVVFDNLGSKLTLIVLVDPANQTQDQPACNACNNYTSNFDPPYHPVKTHTQQTLSPNLISPAASPKPATKQR